MLYYKIKLLTLKLIRLIVKLFMMIFKDDNCVHFVGSYYVCNKHNKLSLISRGEGDNYYLSSDEAVNFLKELFILNSLIDDSDQKNIEHVILIGFITIKVKKRKSLFSDQIVYDVDFYSNERATPSSSAVVSREQFVSGLAHAISFTRDALLKAGRSE